jgi:hypothetical protein
MGLAMAAAVDIVWQTHRIIWVNPGKQGVILIIRIRTKVRGLTMTCGSNGSRHGDLRWVVGWHAPTNWATWIFSPLSILNYASFLSLLSPSVLGFLLQM